MGSWCTPLILNILQNTTPNPFYIWLNLQHSNLDPLINLPTLTNTQTSTLNAINTETTNVLKCLTDINNSISAINTENALTRTAIATQKKELLSRDDDIKISKDRALLVRHPELSRSYYEGWFSLNRPIHQLSVPILIGGAVFLICISLFMMLNFVNINTVFTVLIPKTHEFARDRYGKPYYSSQFGSPFIMMSGISVILFILTIYAFTK